MANWSAPELPVDEDEEIDLSSDYTDDELDELQDWIDGSDESRSINASNVRAWLLRYSDDQARDDNGRFAGGGDSTVAPITADEVAGTNSKAVDADTFQQLAESGKNQLADIQSDKRPEVSDVTVDVGAAYTAVQDSWGGATIDPTTGEPKDFASGFAVTIRDPGQEQVSVPEKATQEEFATAVDTAKDLYADQLQGKDTYFGVFHDDMKGTIDIDPVTVVSSQESAEAIGAYTHAVGGAYDFSTGNGVYPPHVAGG